MKTTLKDIKNTNAIDVTYLSAEELYKLEKEEGCLMKLPIVQELMV